MLRPALRRALEVGLADPDEVVPGRLRRYIGFTRVNDQVLRAVRRTLDDDDDFRLRVREVIGGDGGAELVGPAGWLLLDRPEGWELELDALVAAEAEEAAAEVAARSEARASRQLQRVSDALAAAEADRAAALVDVARLRGELVAERAERVEVERRLEAVVGDRADAVRKLKAVEERLAERTLRLRALEAELADAEARTVEPRPPDPSRAGGTAAPRALPAPDATPGHDAAPTPDGAPAPEARPALEVRPASEARPAPEVRPAPDARPASEASSAAAAGRGIAPAAATPEPAPAWSDPTAARERITEAGRAAAALAAALGELASLLGPAPDGAVAPHDGPPGADRRERRRHPRVRRPLRVPVGLFDDSPEAAVHLLRHPGVLVLVDGWNVSMAGWPGLDKDLQRMRLLDALRSLETRTGARITVVFDSSLDERSLPPASLVRSVQVRFAPVGVTADDELLAAVDALPAEQPVVVVTADRAVADGAAARGANVVPTTALLALL